MKAPDKAVAALILTVLLLPANASAIYSQPAALLNSGPVKVNVDIEISEAAKLLAKASVRSHVEDRLNADGVQVIREAEGQEIPNIVTASEREPAQIWVNVATRRIGEPSGYIVSMEVSHLQPILMKRVDPVPIEGLGWHESWTSVVPDGADLTSATNTALDSMIDDFARDYQAANHPQPAQ